MSIPTMLLLQAVVFSFLLVSAAIYMIIRITRHTNSAAKRHTLVVPIKIAAKRVRAQP